MIHFSDIVDQRGLQRYLSSAMGTLYFVPGAQGDRILVRHFDTERPVDAQAYAELIDSIADFVEASPSIEKFVQIDRPVERGADFIARPYPMYHVSLADYGDPDEPSEPPAELRLMRQALEADLTGSDAPPKVIARVLRASLAEPTGRTYFRASDSRFEVVEPKINNADVSEWRARSV